MDDLPIADFPQMTPWPAPEEVALAFSGGADSVYLALAWQQWSGQESPRLWVVDHGHHAHSAARAAEAATLGEEIGGRVRILTAAGQNPTASTDQAPKEAALRDLRYQLLIEAAADDGCSVVLFGHHADDQAETVLFRILRGTGLRGLAGMPARRELAPGVELRRPLLSLRRDAIRADLRKRQQRWLDDPTNQDPDYASRNRLRLVGLPALSGVASADPVEALLHLQRDAMAWRESRDALVAAGHDWRTLPTFLRRAVIADRLREASLRVSAQRLADLESALLARGSSGVDERWRLSVAAGTLQLKPRRHPAERRR